eukprot:TRINITY_DN61288_c0_g1_i1.p2 TRINITY_DN61288_c0_g1~~TRINITY_DN61288_c0_g1_i1.p2  ORF type:complete len:103 (-),score=19.32 TRINITY_DN61288_c0_g1_i1:211-519(-)
MLWLFVFVFIVLLMFIFFFSSRRRHTRCREVSWARRCVQETDEEHFKCLHTGRSNQQIRKLTQSDASDTFLPAIHPFHICLLYRSEWRRPSKRTLLNLTLPS